MTDLIKQIQALPNTVAWVDHNWKCLRVGEQRGAGVRLTNLSLKEQVLQDYIDSRS